jgi:soluble lytic murein transglycosylase-like protein
MDKKLTIQLLSMVLVRFLFITVMMSSVYISSAYNNHKSTPAVKKKAVILQRTNAQSFVKNYILARTEESSLSGRGKKAERLFHPIILNAASRYQVDPDLIKAIIMAESGYNPRAISKRGAKGLMQLMPKTAQALGVEDSFNPGQNISGGVRYFKQLVNQFDGDIKLALAAYNAGSSKVRYYRGIPPFKATKYYIKKVFKYYQLYKNRMPKEFNRA